MRPALLYIIATCLLAPGSHLYGQTKPVTRPVVFRAAVNGPLPTTPGDHKLRFRTKVRSKTIDLAFLLHLPDDYGKPDRKSPMLVFFHGLGECGTDLGAITRLGPMSKIEADPVFARSCPLIILSPQCPPRGQRWEDRDMNQAVVDLVSRILREMSADPDRVYATGLSMGGAGTWATAVFAPDVFAAISPISAIAWKPDLASHQLTYVSIWNICGSNDGPRFLEGTQQMQLSLGGDFADDHFTYLVGNAHDAWFPAYDSPQFYEWLLAHRRPTPAERLQLEQGERCDSWPLPSARGVSLRRLPVHVIDQAFDLYYTQFVPPQLANAVAAPQPLMLFLHDTAEVGPDLFGLCPHGPDRAILSAPSDALPPQIPMLIVSPRLPIKTQWNSPGMIAALNELIDHVAAERPIDRSRITIVGQQVGAIGAMTLARGEPGRFAGVAAIFNSPLADVPAVDPQMPTWLSSPDPAVRDRLQNARLPADHLLLDDRPEHAFESAAIYDWLAKCQRITGPNATAFAH